MLGYLLGVVMGAFVVYYPLSVLIRAIKGAV